MLAHYTIADTIPENHELLLNYSPLVAQLLLNRGIETSKDAQSFLEPSWDNNHDPFLMKNIKEGIERLKTAIDNQEKITIYADYDADGIPGAVVLSSLLEKIKYENFDIYLPHRHDEGYGIHLEALEKIKDSGTTLVITIDVGITGHEAALWAKDHDIDMIITDHHEPLLNEDGTQNLPQPLYLINPKQEGCEYPDDMLCGCGVIFKFVQAYISEYGSEYNIHEGWEKWLLDMVGLSTISDMVPLVNENRIFAYFGMKVIPQTKRKGLKKLIWDAGLDLRYMTEEDLAFSITPKLNAASRMSHPKDALAALRATKDLNATVAVNHLNKLNTQRKKLVATTMKQAVAKLSNRDTGPVIVVGAPDWQAGILGLVASKLVERYKASAFVWSEENGVIKGSCRSYNGTHLVELMSAAQDKSFIQFGGHAEAGGFSCEKSEIHFLQERLDKAFKGYEQEGEKKEDEVLNVDSEMNLDDINYKAYQEMRRLAPFGQANVKPLFIFKGVTPQSVEQFGKDKNHLKLWFDKGDGTKISAIKFFADAQSFDKELKAGTPIDLIAHIDFSVFRGTKELRLSIVDVV
jgi:single-stranded-DNA-specific exonuclease